MLIMLLLHLSFPESELEGDCYSFERKYLIQITRVSELWNVGKTGEQSLEDNFSQYRYMAGVSEKTYAFDELIPELKVLCQIFIQDSRPSS